jgi:hypothetical protein
VPDAVGCEPVAAFVEPPPSSHCKFCSDELRLKLIELANPNLDFDNAIFVCVNCDREQSYAVSHHNRTGGLVLRA